MSRGSLLIKPQGITDVVINDDEEEESLDPVEATNMQSNQMKSNSIIRNNIQLELNSKETHYGLGTKIK